MCVCVGGGGVSFTKRGSASLNALPGTGGGLLQVRMQLQGEQGAVIKYRNGFHAFRTTFQTEGAAGLFKGLAPALLRQSVSHSTIAWA